MTYNLLDEGWIPVLLRDGQAADISIRECFQQAEKIRRINGDLPTQGFAILRVLLAICHDALGFHSRSDARRLLTTGLDTTGVLTYLDSMADRFDLFHPTRPFMQVVDLRTGKGEIAGLEKLICDVPNGIAFLTVRTGPGLERISAAEAARWLVHAHAFDPSGIRSAAVGDRHTKGGKGYPVGPGWAGQIGGLVYHGDSLAKTLALNIVPTPHNAADVPVWALNSPQTEQRQLDPQPNGPVELLVWQTRRIRLVGDRDGVTGVVLAQGDKMTPQNRHTLEPMTGWRYSKPQSAKLKLAVYMPQKHDPERSFWRGLPAQLPGQPPEVDGHPATRRSLVAENLSMLEDDLPAAVEQIHLEAVGIDYGPQEATVAELVHDTLDLRISLLGADAEAVAVMIRDCVQTADTCVWNLGRMASNVAASAGDFDGLEGAAERARLRGWAALDEVAPVWIAQLTSASDPMTERRRWQELVKDALEAIATALADAAPPAAYAGRSTKHGFMTVGKAESLFRYTLRKELPLAYPAPTPTKEESE